MCHLCDHHCQGCVRTCVCVGGGGGFQNRGEALFVLVLSNINIVWQKSLSAPLRTIHTACFENIYIYSYV